MNIIVNGGSRGIGKEVVRILAGNASHKILVTGRNEKSLKEVTGDLQNVNYFVLDLMDFESTVKKFLEVISANYGKIDILINSAGYLVSKDFLAATDKEARQIFETNFFGPAFMIRSLQPFLTKGSHIVNISSMGGFQGSAKYNGLSWYSASKAAIAVLTECLAIEFAIFGIRVNCLALGSVQTEMLEEAFPGYKAPVNAGEMARFISDFALNGHKFFNGKILPVAITNP